MKTVFSHCLKAKPPFLNFFFYFSNIFKSPDFLKAYDAAGTIQDYVVAMLCDLKKPLMSVQNAASWGYFNCRNKSWNSDM